MVLTPPILILSSTPRGADAIMIMSTLKMTALPPHAAPLLAPPSHTTPSSLSHLQSPLGESFNSLNIYVDETSKQNIVCSFGGFGVVRAPASLCRQCPSYIGTPPTTSRVPPSFTCSPSTNHVLCLCCMRPMPDRRRDSDVTIPPQKCE